MAPYSWYPVDSVSDDTDQHNKESTHPKKNKKISNRRNKNRVDANRDITVINMEEELEVVKISPSAALDRALQKDRKIDNEKISEVYEKKMYDDDDNVEDGNDDVDSEVEDEEEVGQELLWRENATARPTKNRKFRFKLPKLTKKQPIDPSTVSLSDKVWVIPTTNIPHEYQERVAHKSQEARQYLEQALSSSAVSTPVERDANCRKAFFHAAEARRLVDPTSVKELEDMRLQGEYEAREASRILALALTSSPSSSDKHVQETDAMNEQSDAILPSKHSASNFTITPISEMMRLANAHAEAARHYLESILPKFQETKHDDTNSFNSGQDDLNVPENKSEDIDEEVRENGKPAIVMIENSTISSLGFDNTFRNDVSIMNLNSLNAILDGPMSETGNSDNVISPVSNLDVEDKENHNVDPNDKTRPGGWFRHISQRPRSGQFWNKNQSQMVQDDLRRVQSVERRTGEILQRAWKESPDARLGVSPVQPSAPAFVTAPVFPPGILSAKSWESLADGIPLEEVVPPPEEETESNEVNEIQGQSVKKPKLQFWKSKKFHFNSKRKQGVTKSEPFGKDSAVLSQGIQVDEKEPNPIASADTNATDVVTPNVSSGEADDPVLRSSSSMEADRYTAMYDVEDGVHLAAAKRLASSGTNLPPMESVVDKIRNVFSWGGGGDVGKRQNSLGVQPDFVEVHKEGEIGEDSTNVVLANSETVANAIQSSVPIEQPPEVKTSYSYDPNATRSDSIQDQIEERKREILEQNTVKENKSFNVKEKRRFFKRLTARRGEI